MTLNMLFHRLIILSAIFMIAPIRSYSRKDSVWVVLTFTNQIADGRKSSRETVTSQKTYTLNWKILRELKLDSLTASAYAYKVYFYDDKDRLSSLEEYSMRDSLISGMKYGYDNNGRINEIKYFVSESSRVPLLKKREVYSYYGDTLKKSVKSFNSKGKRICSAAYRYDPQKKENFINTRYRIAADGIIKSGEKHLLDDRGSIKEIYQTIRLKNGKVLNLKSVYEYNDQHLLTSVKKYWEGEPDAVINYEYYATKRLLSIEERNKDDMLVSYRHFDYQIHYINPGKNKSLL